MFIHIKFFFVLFFNLIWVRGFSIGSLLFSSFEALSKYVWEFGLPMTLSIWIFHHISTSMPPIISCVIEGRFMTIITWNYVYNFVILILFVKDKDENFLFYAVLANLSSIFPLRIMRCNASPLTKFFPTFSPFSFSFLKFHHNNLLPWYFLLWNGNWFKDLL